MSYTKQFSKILVATALVVLISACSQSSNDYTLVEPRIGAHTNYDLCSPQCMKQKTVMYRTERHRQRTHTEVNLTKEERTVYFKFNRAELTTAAQERLSTLANVLKANESVKEAIVVGYADRIGSVQYNEELSQRRAETVRDFLIANGYTNARVTETRWVGETEPSTNCPNAGSRPELIECLQRDRRVEVDIGYQNEEQVPNAR